MKVKIVLFALLSIVLLLVPCGFAQQAGQDPNSLARFQTALRQDGFAVTPGAAEAANIVEKWCSYQADSAFYGNNEPYVQVELPTSAGQLSTDFQLRPDEAVVLIE